MPDETFTPAGMTRAPYEMTCHRCGLSIWTNVFYEIDEYGEPTHTFCFPPQLDPLRPK